MHFDGILIFLSSTVSNTFAQWGHNLRYLPPHKRNNGHTSSSTSFESKFTQKIISQNDTLLKLTLSFEVRSNSTSQRMSHWSNC